MKILLVTFFSLCLLACTGNVQPTGDVGYSRMFKTPLKIEKRFVHSEGPAVASDGTVYFSDVLGRRILKWRPGELVTEYLNPSFGANGLMFDKNGDLIACEGAHGYDEPVLSRRNLQTGKREIIADNIDGKKFNSPNDLVMTKNGDIYFSDPRWGNQAGREIETEDIYLVKKNGEVKRVATAPDVFKPNGVILSPDEKTLYAAETIPKKLTKNGRSHGKIIKFKVNPDGSLSDAATFYEFPAGRGIDGFAIDVAGNLYAAGGLTGSGVKPGIYVFNPDGKLLTLLNIPTDHVTNAQFGGDDLKTLYITSGIHLYSIRTANAGYLSQSSVKPEPPVVVSGSAVFTSKLETIYRFVHSEGPAVAQDGTVYFSDVRGQRILKYKSGDPYTQEVVNPSHGANGLAFDKRGYLLTAEGSRGLGQALIGRINLNNGEKEILASHYDNKKLNSPNDLLVAQDGSIYFGDPRYGSQKGRELDSEDIYRILPNGDLERMATAPDIYKPNGLAISPDGKSFYSADVIPGKPSEAVLRRFPLNKDGSLGAPSIHYSFGKYRGADGMAIDVKGNLYVAAGFNNTAVPAGVYVIDPAGQKIDFLPVFEDPVTNMVFGGKDMKTLYITAGGYLFSVQTYLKGFKPF